MEGLYIGIDIAKATFDVAHLDGRGVTSKTYPNTPKGQAAFLKVLAAADKPPVRIGMEATGRYWEALAQGLHTAGYALSVLNPAQISAFRKATLKRAKTDRTDATLIATFCQQCNPLLWVPPTPAVHELQALTHQYQALLTERERVNNRLKALNPSAFVTQQLQAQFAFIKRQIKALLAQIRAHLDDDPDLRRQRDLLLSIPGIGPVTVAAILAEIGDASQFASADQLVAYAGLSPSVFTSGSSVHKRPRLSKTGNSNLRKALFFPAMAAKRHNPRVRDLAERLLAKGKSKMLVMGAAMHKLLRLVFGVLRSQRPFAPFPS